MTHFMKLVDFAFRAVAKGEKTYELRLNDEKRKKIRVGDRIVFSCRGKDHQVAVRVKGLFPFPDFHKLYATLPLEQCGYDESTLPYAHPRDMEQFYSPQEIQRWGVLAIAIEREQWETARHYDALIEEDNDPVWDPPLLRDYMNRWDGEPFLRLLSPSPQERALEIGVGSGRLALRTAPRFGELYGVDLSLLSIERAQKNLAHCSNVRLICCDFLCYPFPLSFDCIYSSLTFLHIKEKKKAINKAAGLLNSGGRLLVSLDKSREVLLPSPTGSPLSLYPDDPDALLDLIKQAGLFLVAKESTEAAILLLAEKK